MSLRVEGHARLHSADNTNADPEVRSKWIQLARQFGVPIRCVYFTASPPLCQHNDTVRALNGLVVSGHLGRRRPSSRRLPASRPGNGEGSLKQTTADEPREAEDVECHGISWLHQPLRSTPSGGRVSRHYHCQFRGAYQVSSQRTGSLAVARARASMELVRHKSSTGGQYS